MVNAVVLINAETHKINDLAEKLAEIEGINEVFSVAGRYDLVATIRVSENEEVAEVVSVRMRELDGIVNSETLIAFRVYSRKDIQEAFSLGSE